MIVKDQDALLPNSNKPYEPKQVSANDTVPGLLDVAAASFRQSNTIASMASYFASGIIGERENFDYNAMAAIKDSPYMEYAERFFDTDSDEDVATIKQRIDRELEDRKILSERPVAGFLMSLAAATLDPINLLPIGGSAISAAKTAGNLGSAALRAGISTGTVAAVSNAASELVLQSTQEVRSLEESFLAVGGGFVLGGLLGAGAGAYGSYKSISSIEKDMYQPLTPKDFGKAVMETEEMIARTPDSVGAASIRKSDEELLNDNTIIPGIGTTIAKVVRNLTPEQNLLQSPSLASREIFQSLANTSHIFNKNLEGVATEVPVETLISRWNAPLADFLEGQKTAYKNYAKKTDSPITWSQFKDQVALAAIRGDTHEIPHIEQTAKLLREKILAPALAKGKKVGLFPEDMTTTTALSYFPRVWDQAKVKAYRPLLKERIVSHLKGEVNARPVDKGAMLKRKKEILVRNAELLEQLNNSESASKINAANKELHSLVREYSDIAMHLALSARTDKAFANVADEIIDSISGLQDGVNINSVDLITGISSSAKARVFNIPDEMIRDFLITDTERVVKGYLNSIAPDIEIMGKYGDLKLTAQTRAIEKDYQKLIDNAETPKARLALEKRRDNDQRDVRFIVERLRGISNRNSEPDNLIKNANYAARSLAYTLYLGKQLFSAVPDLARLIEINGFKGLFRDALVPAITDWKNFKISAAEAKLAGEALEVILNNTRLQVLADLKNPPLGSGRLKPGLKATTDLFTKLSGINHFDSARKQMMAVILQRKNIENMSKWVKGSLSEKDVAELARFGIDEFQAARILKMWDKHGSKEGNLYIAGTSEWEDGIALDSFRNLLNRQINHYSTMPGVATAPRFMNNDTSRIFFMFQQFNMAATSKILISGLNQMDMNIMQAWATSIALGMTAYALHNKISGKELSDNPLEWIAEGVDRSGIAGGFATANDYLYTMTGGSLTASRLIGVEQGNYKAKAQERVTRLGGPAAQMMANMLTVADGAFPGNEWQGKNTHALRQLMPFQNLFYMSWLFDEMEEGINSQLGVNR